MKALFAALVLTSICAYAQAQADTLSSDLNTIDLYNGDQVSHVVDATPRSIFLTKDGSFVKFGAKKSQKIIADIVAQVNAGALDVPSSKEVLLKTKLARDLTRANDADLRSELESYMQARQIRASLLQADATEIANLAGLKVHVNNTPFAFCAAQIENESERDLITKPNFENTRAMVCLLSTGLCHGHARIIKLQGPNWAQQNIEIKSIEEATYNDDCEG
jgi:hypothetical protein